MININHIRSLLFCPANENKKFPKALNSAADLIIFDLEDAVPSHEKPDARMGLKDWLSEQKEEAINRMVLRINPVDTKDNILDVEMFLSLKNYPKIVMLPKAESESHILTIKKLLNKKEVLFIPLIESAKGIENIACILKQHNNIISLMMGSADLSSDIGCENNRTALLYANSKVLLHAASYKIPVIDSPYFNISDSKGCFDDTEFGKSIGFEARAAIHPKQIALINEIYTPTAEQIANAQNIINIAKEGVGKIGGKMVDEAMAKKARKLIEKSKYSKT